MKSLWNGAVEKEPNSSFAQLSTAVVVSRNSKIEVSRLSWSIHCKYLKKPAFSKMRKKFSLFKFLKPNMTKVFKKHCSKYRKAFHLIFLKRPFFLDATFSLLFFACMRSFFKSNGKLKGKLLTLLKRFFFQVTLLRNHINVQHCKENRKAACKVSSSHVQKVWIDLHWRKKVLTDTSVYLILYLLD